MLYKNIHDNDVRYGAPTADADLVGGGQFFWATKRLFDVALSLFLLPILISAAIAIILLNPFLNRGPLLFFQKRMGRNCLPFYAIKFRSMTKVAEIIRAHDDPIELDRITWLGRFMRKTRIDELPQILNVLKGEMSLIGPRPDFYEHACVFVTTIPGYAERHVVRPGISGLAQVDLGYAVGSTATRKKVEKDLHYIQHAGFLMEARLFLATIVTVVIMAGA